MNKSEYTKYKNYFAKEHYDRISLSVPKGMKAEIENYRKEKGFKSLNDYINEIIKRDMYEDDDKA